MFNSLCLFGQNISLLIFLYTNMRRKPEGIPLISILYIRRNISLVIPLLNDDLPDVMLGSAEKLSDAHES